MSSAERLLVLTGTPGTGKTTVANLIQPHLPPGWALLHGDDFIGVTQACYPGRPWESIRRFLPFFLGWAAGWYLWSGHGVLVEGHLRDAQELDRLERGARDLCPGLAPISVVRLEGDAPEIAARLARNPLREPQWDGPDREANFLAWLKVAALEEGLSGDAVQIGDLAPEILAKEIAGRMGLAWG